MHVTYHFLDAQDCVFCATAHVFWFVGWVDHEVPIQALDNASPPLKICVTEVKKFFEGVPA